MASLNICDLNMKQRSVNQGLHTRCAVDRLWLWESSHGWHPFDANICNSVEKQYTKYMKLKLSSQSASPSFRFSVGTEIYDLNIEHFWQQNIATKSTRSIKRGDYSLGKAAWYFFRTDDKFVRFPPLNENVLEEAFWAGDNRASIVSPLTGCTPIWGCNLNAEELKKYCPAFPTHKEHWNPYASLEDMEMITSNTTAKLRREWIFSCIESAGQNLSSAGLCDEIEENTNAGGNLVAVCRKDTLVSDIWDRGCDKHNLEHADELSANQTCDTSRTENSSTALQSSSTSSGGALTIKIEQKVDSLDKDMILLFFKKGVQLLRESSTTQSTTPPENASDAILSRCWSQISALINTEIFNKLENTKTTSTEIPTISTHENDNITRTPGASGSACLGRKACYDAARRRSSQQYCCEICADAHAKMLNLHLCSMEVSACKEWMQAGSCCQRSKHRTAYREICDCCFGTSSCSGVKKCAFKHYNATLTPMCAVHYPHWGLTSAKACTEDDGLRYEGKRHRRACTSSQSSEENGCALGQPKVHNRVRRNQPELSLLLKQQHIASEGQRDFLSQLISQYQKCLNTQTQQQDLLRKIFHRQVKLPDQLNTKLAAAVGQSLSNTMKECFDHIQRSITQTKAEMQRHFVAANSKEVFLLKKKNVAALMLQERTKILQILAREAVEFRKKKFQHDSMLLQLYKKLQGKLEAQLSAQIDTLTQTECDEKLVIKTESSRVKIESEASSIFEERTLHTPEVHCIASTDSEGLKPDECSLIHCSANETDSSDESEDGWIGARILKEKQISPRHTFQMNSDDEFMYV